jgi:hypothetical protein
MVNTAEISKGVIACVLLACLSGCGSSSSDANDSSDTNNSSNKKAQIKNKEIRGVLVDGYISGATVCFDKNSNGICDPLEPKATTDKEGAFSFDINITGNTHISFISIGGVDQATDKIVDFSMKRIININKNVNNVEGNTSIIISPLTTIVADQFLQEKTKTAAKLNEISNKIAKTLSLKQNDLTKNPKKDKKVFAATQYIQQTKDLIYQTLKESNNTQASKKEISTAISNSIVTHGTINVKNIVNNISSDSNDNNLSKNITNVLEHQIQNLKTTLSTLENNTSINIKHLDTVQNNISSSISSFVTQIQEKPTDQNLSIIPINISSKKTGITLKDTKYEAYAPLNQETSHQFIMLNGVYYTLVPYTNSNISESDIVTSDAITLQGKFYKRTLPAIKIAKNYEHSKIVIKIYRGKNILSDRTLVAESALLNINGTNISFNNIVANKIDDYRPIAPTDTHIELPPVAPEF